MSQHAEHAEHAAAQAMDNEFDAQRARAGRRRGFLALGVAIALAAGAMAPGGIWLARAISRLTTPILRPNWRK